jgi:RHS repeat-associated protein
LEAGLYLLPNKRLLEVRLLTITVTIPAEPQMLTHTIVYTYDGLYRLTGAGYSNGEQFQYTYDAVGNMTVMTTTITSTVVTTKSYDAANRLTAVTAGGVPRTLAWSDAGELLQDGDDTYQWDAAGRLTQATVEGVTSRFAYLGDGSRMSMTVASQTTTYTLDLVTPLVQMLVANEDGTRTAYLYGVARIGEEDGAWQYYLTDHLGSVRSLVDAEGSVAGTRAYAPYGVVLESAGAAESVYGFTGEQTDPTGLVYLRARMYAPGLELFLSRDALSLEIYVSRSANGFNYADASPINYTDPTGYSSVDQDKAHALWLIGRQLYWQDMTAMDRFVRLLRYATTLYDDSPEGTDQFMIDVSAVVHGHEHNPPLPFFIGYAASTSRWWLGLGGFDRFFNEQNEYECKIVGACDSGWKDKYRDDTGNQAYHFWFYVAVGYFDGEILANSGNLLHESLEWLEENILDHDKGASVEDYLLGRAGMILGRRVRASVQSLNIWDLVYPCGIPSEIILKLLGETPVSQIPQWVENNLAK